MADKWDQLAAQAAGNNTSGSTEGTAGNTNTSATTGDKWAQLEAKARQNNVSSKTSDNSNSPNAIKNAVAAAKRGIAQARNDVVDLLYNDDAAQSWAGKATQQYEDAQANVEKLRAKFDEANNVNLEEKYSRSNDDRDIEIRQKEYEEEKTNRENLKNALAQAEEESKLAKSKMDAAQKVVNNRNAVKEVENAVEKGASYKDQYDAYSQSLEELNKQKAQLTEQLSKIRNGSSYYGAASTSEQDKARQKADEKEATDRLEKLEREIERLEGTRAYARQYLTKDAGAKAVIRQGEELARTAKEQGTEVAESNRAIKKITDYISFAPRYGTARNIAEIIGKLFPNSGVIQDITGAIGNLPEAYNPLSFIAELGIRAGENTPKTPNNNWSQDQLDLYHFFYGNPDYGKEAAEKYAQMVNYAMNTASVNAQTKSDYAAGASKNNGFLKTVGGLAGAVPDMALAAGDAQNKLLDILATGTYAGHDTATAHERFSAFSQGRADTLNSKTLSESIPVIGGKGWGDLYQLGQSALQSISSGHILGEAATLGAFFVNAANSSFDEAMQRSGGNTEYASTVGLLSGAAEALSEMLPLDHLLKGGKVGSLSYILKQQGLEGIGEGSSSLMNLFFDHVAAKLTGEQSAVQQQISNLVRQGMSYEDAEKKVWRDTASDVAFDVAGGTISGGFSAAAQSVQNNLYNYTQNRNSRNQQNTQTAQPKKTDVNQRPTTRNPLYEALNPQTPAAETATVAENATTDAPARPSNPLYDSLQTAQKAAGVQEAPEGQVTQPTAETTPQEAGTAQDGQTSAQAAEEPPKSNVQRFQEIQKRLEEINNALNENPDEETASSLYEEGEALYQESRQLESLPEVIQQKRVDAGEVSKGFGTVENHIDNRTDKDLSKPSVKAFQFDYPELHQYFVDVAQELIADVEYAEKLTKANMYELGSAVESGPVRQLMDMGLTKPEIIKALQDIIANNGQENYAKAKKVERVLSEMMTDGWRDLKNQNHDAVPDYIAAKDSINGAVKSDSWEKYLADHETVLALGEVTEEQLRAEWEQMHPQEEAAAVAEPAPETSQPVETASAAPEPAPQPGTEGTQSEQSAGTIPASEQTTAERTNGTGNERERNMSRNLRGNEKAEPDLRNSFEQNRDLYTQLTNAEVAAKAAEIIGKGYDAAKNDIYEKIGQAKAGAKLAPEYAVAGYQLANEMVRRGEVEAARELCADIAAELTYAGQVGQIGRLILAADPSIRIRTVERLVKKLNDGLSNRQKAKNVENGVGTETGNIKVSDEALQEYAAAETDEAANKALDAIEQEIAEQIPATFRDKFTALRYLNMLGNLKTQGRNIVGNAAMMTATNIKYLTQHVIELARAAATGGKAEVNTALNTSKELRQQAAADFEAHADEIKGESKYSDVGRQAAKGIQDKRQIFGTTGNKLWDNTVGRGLEWARKRTTDAMEIGDEIFLRQVYIRSFAGWMKAHGVTDVNSASAEQVSAAREFAKKEAQEATFHDSNKVSDWVSSLGRGPNTLEAVKMISEGVVPFRRTPANVAVRAVEYSPVGAIGTIYEAIQAKKGNASAADVINSAAKNLTGTALFGIGMLLAAAGRARASGDDEDEKLANFQKLQGTMDYSVKVGDTYISLSQLAPMAIPFFMGVKLNELLEYSDNLFSADSIGDILGVVSEPMLEMSMLSGVNDFLNDLSSVSGDTDALPSLIGNAALSYLSQGLTNSLLGQLEQASERNRQTIYSDTKSKAATAFDRLLGKNQYKIGKYSAKIPGLDYNQQDYVDAWGRTQSNGGAGERAFNAFLNPTYTGKDRSTDVDEELERLYRDNKGKDGFPNVFPQKRSRSDTIDDGVVMTPDEYLSYSKESGQKKLELVREFIQSSDYKNLTDEQRAETIHNLYAFADATALQKVRDANGVKTESDYTKLMRGVDKPGDSNDVPALKEKNAGEYIAFDTSYKNAVKTGDYSNIDNLLARYANLDKNTQAVIAAKNPESINNLLKYSQAGASSKSYFTVKDSISAAQAELNKNSSQGGDVQMLGLASADIPESEKAKLIESGAFELSKNRKAAYDVLSNYGFTVKDAYDFFEDADYTYSSKSGKYEADGVLSPLEVAAAIQRSGIPGGQKEAAFNAVRELLKGNGNPDYDKWVDKRGNPWTYQSEIDYLKRTGYTYGKGGSIKPKSSGNALYDYYSERQRKTG